MEEKKYLNVGCGKKFYEGGHWENIDMVSFSKFVRQHNILKGFPYKDNSFDAVYHSQVLEHIPKEEAVDFLKECHRVLKVGGIVRIVVPDLENIINEYQKHLHENLQNPTDESKANYDWIMLELFDQVIRNKTGGLMKEYLKTPNLVNEDYINTRLGHVGRKNRKNRNETTVQKLKRVSKDIKTFYLIKIGMNMAVKKVLYFILGKKYKIGDFRLGGEIHYWMYDRFSLSELLKSIGFQDIKIQSPHSSDIPAWETYELDVKNGEICDPTSLFIEAKKV